MVMSWLLNSMINEIGILCTTRLRRRYRVQPKKPIPIDNTSVIFEIKGIRHDLRQGDSSVIDYLNMLIRYWQQLACPKMLHGAVLMMASSTGKSRKKNEFISFSGLNRDLYEVCARILSIKALVSVRDVLFEVRREES